MLTAKDLIEESEDELQNKLITLKKEIFEIRSERLDAKTKQTHLIGQKRKEIARIMTVINERKLKRSHD